MTQDYQDYPHVRMLHLMLHTARCIMDCMMSSGEVRVETTFYPSDLQMTFYWDAEVWKFQVRRFLDHVAIQCYPVTQSLDIRGLEAIFFNDQLFQSALGQDIEDEKALRDVLGRILRMIRPPSGALRPRTILKGLDTSIVALSALSHFIDDLFPETLIREHKTDAFTFLIPILEEGEPHTCVMILGGGLEVKFPPPALRRDRAFNGRPWKYRGFEGAKDFRIRDVSDIPEAIRYLRTLLQGVK